jgi:hypothetical protein
MNCNARTQLYLMQLKLLKHKRPKLQLLQNHIPCITESEICKIHSHEKVRRSRTIVKRYLRSKIWNGDSCENKASNNVIRWRPSLYVSRDKPFVSGKLYTEFENFRVTKHFDMCLLTGIFLRYKVAETYSLAMPKWN